jgi:hypothetical protein
VDKSIRESVFLLLLCSVPVFDRVTQAGYIAYKHMHKDAECDCNILVNLRAQNGEILKAVLSTWASKTILENGQSAFRHVIRVTRLEPRCTGSVCIAYEDEVISR